MTDNNFQIHSAAVSDRGLSEKRPQNEDSYLEMQNLGLFAVADGVGGAQAGDVASQMAMEILGEAFVNLQAGGDVEDMMKIAIERANSAIYQMSSDLPQLSTMATTIVALHITGNIATIGHVGDSRLYRLDGKGSLFRETQDHSVVEEEVRAGRMTAAQAANHPSRNVISRALGAESTVEVDMKTIMFDGNTTFLLCSDGITRHISDFEIRELLMTGAAPAEVCAKMKDICYSRGAEDNLTAVIINVFRAAEENIQDLPTIMPDADDEATVATARQTVPETAPASYETAPVYLDPDYDETPTRSLEMPAASMQAQTETVSTAESSDFSNDDDESYLMEEPAPVIAPLASEPAEIPSPPAYSVSAVNENAPPVQPAPVVTRNDFTSYETEEKNGSGVVGKLLSSLILLVIGAILGVAGYYFWQMSVAEKPVVPVLTPQTNDVTKDEFYNSLYNAETNPEQFTRQYDTVTQKDAQDFYVLGRAFLKLKNYEEAKKNFILARNNLREVKDPKRKAILATEITEGLIIAQDKAAQLAFEKELKISTESDAVQQTNSNQ